MTSALEASLHSQGLSGTQTLQSTGTTTFPDGSVATASATAVANGELSGQGQGGSALPHYAIALIAVFGFLTLVAGIVGLYFILAASRRRRSRNRYDYDSAQGSSTPMMAETDQQEEATRSSVVHRSSRPRHSRPTDAEDIPFSFHEASRLAAAFRSALRRPQFGSISHRSSLGTADASVTDPRESSTHHHNDSTYNPALELLREELTSEGRDLMNVEGRRQPEVHQ